MSKLSSVPFKVSLPDGANIEGHRQGNGPALVFISGLGGTGAFWRPVIEQLPGHSCITFDQRGVGRSSRGDSAVSIHQLALDTLAVLDALQLDQPILIGHSTGGCIAMECALSAPEKITALVLSGTWAGPNDYMAELFHVRSQLLNTNPVLYQSINSYLSYPAEWLIKKPDILSPTNFQAWDTIRVRLVQERIDALLAFDQRESLKTLIKPCLVLGAHDDLVVPLSLQHELLDLLPVKRTHKHFFNRGGHFYPVSRAKAFTEQIIQWIQIIR